MGLAFAEGRGQLPQRGQLAIGGAGRQAGEQLAHALARRLGRLPHHHEHLRLEGRVRVGIGLAGRHVGVHRQIAPAPVVRPQVGRVDALGAGQLLELAERREQRQRGHRLARQAARQVVEQREGAVLDHLDRGGIELLGALRKTLDRRLAGAQQHGAGLQAHQLERTGALVELLPRLAQHTGVDRIDVGAADRLAFLDVAAQGLVGRLERLAQLFMDPRDRAQVVGHLGVACIHRALS